MDSQTVIRQLLEKNTHVVFRNVAVRMTVRVKIKLLCIRMMLIKTIIGTFSNTHRRLCEGTLFRSSRKANHRTISAKITERVLEVVHGDPKISTRRITLRLDISHWTAWKVLNDEGLYPFHTLQVQKLE